MIRKTLLAALAATTLVAPALAAPLLYECKVDRLGDKKLSDAQRADPQTMFRFAVDLETAKGCIVHEGGACTPVFGPLALSQKATAISGSGKRAADGGIVTLTFLSDRMRAVFMSGGVTISTRDKDCTASATPFALP